MQSHLIIFFKKKKKLKVQEEARIYFGVEGVGIGLCKSCVAEFKKSTTVPEIQNNDLIEETEIDGKKVAFIRIHKEKSESRNTRMKRAVYQKQNAVLDGVLGISNN